MSPASSKVAASSKIAHLQKRAAFLHDARAFFHKRSVMEVDTPALCQFPAIDSAIQVIELANSSQDQKTPSQNRYLHTSPEYGMKRLLALGIGDIYQLSHVFRKDEIGQFHNPEFSMCEWYRMGWELKPFIEEVLEFIELFIGKKPREFLTYEKAFIKYLQVSSLESFSILAEVANARGCSSILSHDEVLDFLFGELEKELPQDVIVVVTDFPPSKAALSEVCLSEDGNWVAKRFEIFYRGIELANGYQELTDPAEQKRRLQAEAKKYQEIHGKDLPVDHLFIEALEEGVPPCCGVACGFDRLVMLGLDLGDLFNILPWSWSEA